MRYFLPLLFLSFSVFAQNECEQTVSSSAKKHYKKAEDAARNWQYEEAYSFLEIALDEQPDYAKAFFLYGQLKMEKEEFEQAQELLIKGISVCPMYSEEMYWLVASMAFELENYERAAYYFESYLRFFGLSEEKKELAQYRWDKARFFIKMYSMPVPYNPQPLLGVSTKDDEYLPILSPDNQIAFFTRRRVKQDLGMLRAETVEEFVFSYMHGDYFNSGNLMPHPFNLHDNEGGASLTIDNNELFLTICEPVNGYNNCDIYYTYRQDSLWFPLRRLLYPVNKSDSWDSQPTISSDGNTLMFTSIRSGGKGGSDIYSVSRTENGSWGDLKSLSINTPGDEKSPFLHPDNQTLYFSSDGHRGLGGLDIFYVKKDATGNWGEPQNIGYPINSILDDLGFFVSTDGKTAYFASNKLEGKGGWDVYHFPLYKEARPERVLFLKGDVLNESGEPLNAASVEIKSMKNDSTFEVDIDVETGRYVAAVLLDKDEDVIVTVKDSLHAFNSQYISAIDEAFESPTKLDFDMMKVQEGEAFRINNIYFETDSFSLNQQAKNVLSAFVSFLQNRKKMKLSIHGHTDSVGDDQANLLLSTKRAQSVYNFLIASGVSSARLNYEGFGEQNPLETNMTEEGRSQNRRTEFYVIENK